MPPAPLVPAFGAPDARVALVPPALGLAALAPPLAARAAESARPVSVFVVHAATAIKSKSAPMRAVAGARVELVGRRTAREACDMGKIERWAETLIGDVLPCDALLGTKRAARRTSPIADTAHFLQLRPRMPLRSRFRPTLFVARVTGAASAVADRAHAQTPRPTGAPAGGTEAAAVATVCALCAAAERNDLVALDTLYAGDSLTVIEGAGIKPGSTGRGPITATTTSPLNARRCETCGTARRTSRCTRPATWRGRSSATRSGPTSTGAPTE